MILSNLDIKRYLRDGRIRIDPPPSDKQYSTNSVDLLLGDEFMLWLPPDAGVEIAVEPQEVDLPTLIQKYMKAAQTEEDGSFVLGPGRFALGITHEKVVLPTDSRIAARVEGRSKLARLGLSIHLTAPTIHCGFTGKITLEMRNNGPLRLKLRPQKLAVCQLIFEELMSSPEAKASTFDGQTGVAGA
ncbi:MAG TPA: dCTP deaminase [Thermoplasmata archaeon]|nr:dCTP deaminase [Thermoplasmata archaeon]